MNNHIPSTRLARASAAALAAMLIIGASGTKAVPLSPALNLIAADFTMAKSGITGAPVCFSKEDFAASLGVESVGKITITSLPDLSLGHLQLGNRYVEEGQVISEKNLDSLKFVPYGNEEAEAVFSFCRGKDPFGTAYECSIFTLDHVNTAPVVASADSVSVSTSEAAFSGTANLGTIPASDAEGDLMSFEIIRAPFQGELVLTDSEKGYYEYTPDAAFTGPDSFVVRVTDCYGNRSADTKITLRVEKPAEGEVFADMDGHWANAAVISCVREGILDAAKAEECFYPDEVMSRAEFLAFAMKSAGYDGFYAAKTGFADDGEIPAEFRGYIGAAEALGIVKGIESDGALMFYPNHQITRLEAAVIVSRLTGIGSEGTAAVYADESVPAWAGSALAGLTGAGILRGTGSEAELYAPLTRGAAAQLAASVAARR